MSDGADVQRLLDIEDIKQLKARYWRYLDTKDWDNWRRVLTDDFHFEADGYVDDGAASIVTVLSTSLAGGVSVHQGHTGEITITGTDSATGVWAFTDWVEHAPDGGHPGRAFRGHGHYHEEYVRTADGWKIARSVVTRLRVDALGAGMPSADELQQVGNADD